MCFSEEVKYIFYWNNIWHIRLEDLWTKSLCNYEMYNKRFIDLYIFLNFISFIGIIDLHK